MMGRLFKKALKAKREWLQGGSGVRKVIIKMLGSSFLLHVNALELIDLVRANQGIPCAVDQERRCEQHPRPIDCTAGFACQRNLSIAGAIATPYVTVAVCEPVGDLFDSSALLSSHDIQSFLLGRYGQSHPSRRPAACMIRRTTATKSCFRPRMP
jgi:hypothetical protein